MKTCGREKMREETNREREYGRGDPEERGRHGNEEESGETNQDAEAKRETKDEAKSSRGKGETIYREATAARKLES